MAYAAVGAAVGAVLLIAPQPPDFGGALVMPTYTYAPTPPPNAASSTDATIDPSPSKVALPVPEGYRRVAGPGGLVTTVPNDWVITRSTGPGAMQATDPTDPTRFVRYGGAAAPPVDLVLSHVDYEGRFAAGKTGFTRLSLGTTTYHGVPAVDWEFQHDGTTGRRHVHSMYWRVNGVEYFLYAASNTDRWADTEAVYHAMIDNASP
ncbi:MAG: hypothetical protein M3548_24025 [Actinomycetota bacterium]|nr:hypothetical protein [Actinomycetota bacterium]